MNKELKLPIKVIGTMSGTSLDGLDIAAVEFDYKNEKWSFNLLSATTVSYSEKWLKKLKNAPSLSGEKLIELHSEYGSFTGANINEFISNTGFKPNLIASHGHTIFHQPEKHFTLQIGNGAEIAAVTKTTTIADFRIGDIALGGQGAPLVPVGDKLLFNDFDYCLNLGGFANISFEKNGKRIAFDISPANFPLNFYAEKQGLLFDKNGELGKQGKLNIKLLSELNSLGFYKQNPPKSLGREWMEQVFYPVLTKYKISDSDIMRTIYEHIAIQIAKTSSGKGKILITGGGAFNTFLIERIKFHSLLEVVIPEQKIVNYKEALIFAFLGVLRIQNKINCYSSVTGASKDSSVGVIFKY
ncbi:MAG: anhydro-N-acetylmuramic acid kinase [Draconibacterium sp.]|nr:anhydro-N-acetylmuramic acid kinase [Draconibacterium sp.]